MSSQFLLEHKPKEDWTCSQDDPVGEYFCIDGNHRLAVMCDLSFSETFLIRAYVTKVCFQKFNILQIHFVWFFFYNEQCNKYVGWCQFRC